MVRKFGKREAPASMVRSRIARKLDDGVYAVYGRGGNAYEVTVDVESLKTTCTCKGGEFGGCWHQVRAFKSARDSGALAVAS